MKLRTRLLAVALAGTLVSAIGVGLGNSYFSRSAILEKLDQNIHLIGDDLSMKVDRWFSDRVTDIKAWSNDTIYANASKDGFVAKSARRTASSRLTALQSGYGYFEALSLATLDGTVVSSSMPDMLGKKMSVDLAAFSNLAPGEVHVSPVQYGDGGAYIVIGAQIYAKKEPIGVLFGKINMSSISGQFFADIPLGEGARAFLIDRAQSIAATNTADMANALGAQIRPQNGDIDVVVGDLFRIATTDGERTGVQTPVGDHGWLVQIDARTDVALEDVKTLLMTSLAITALMFVGVAIILWVVLTLSRCR